MRVLIVCVAVCLHVCMDRVTERRVVVLQARDCIAVRPIKKFLQVGMCVCACIRVCVHACVRACAHSSARHFVAVRGHLRR